MNQCNFIGRFVADPELKQTTGGKMVTSFCLAVKRPMTKDVTDFLNFVAWEKKAEFICRFFKKGNLVAILGSLTSRSFETQDGKRTAYEVVVSDAEFCESKGSTAPTGSARYGAPNVSGGEVSGGAAPKFEEIAEDDDLPF